MGRLRKRTAEYFPHFVGDSRTKFVLENTWGNDGYAFWFKLLELLCRTDGHYYDCSLPTDMKYLTALTKVSAEVANEILNELAEMGKIDAELWTERNVIWCQTLVDNLTMLYAKRTTSIPKKPFSEEQEQQEQPEPEPQQEVPQDAPPQVPPKAEDEPKPDKGKDKPKKKAAPKKETPKKIHYAEFVTMTEEEYGKLVELHGEEKTKRMIEVLDNYKGQNGKRYASDYRAILNWVVGRVDEEIAKNGGYGNGINANRGNAAPPSGGFKPSGGFRGGETP